MTTATNPHLTLLRERLAPLNALKSTLSMSRTSTLVTLAIPAMPAISGPQSWRNALTTDR